jgi:hypothetical protein
VSFAGDRRNVERPREVAPDAEELLRRDGCVFELADELGVRLGSREAHLVALRVSDYSAERVSLDDLGQLVARPHDDVDIEPEPIRDHPLAVARNLLGGGGAREHDVAALEVGPNVVVDRVRERLAELRHRDPVARSEVDAAQEDDHLSHGEEPMERRARAEPQSRRS